MNKTNQKNINKRVFIGTVVKTGMNKTINVLVVTRKLHDKYKKYHRLTKKYHVHDEIEKAQVGDKVKFVECRPLSKTKRWRLLEVLKK